ncbi:EF-hand calcium-binding domain-containing protein 10 [Nowakowskiella sp. JEL0407]|nr:EF-hand calcium-binding domain-containing protein 10 [Nowakowskiella sp. JEL0407]
MTGPTTPQSKNETTSTIDPLIERGVSKKQIDDAMNYLSTNNVYDIIQSVTSSLIYSRPDDPKEFVIKKLEEMRNTKIRGNSIPQYSRDNLVALFRIFDVASRGFITIDQYHSAMFDIGAKDYNKIPSGWATSKISMETFIEEATISLSRL